MIITLIKHIKKFGIFYFIFILFIIYLLSWQPKECYYTFEGVLYRLNDNGIIKETSISFDGKEIKPIFGRVRYFGSIIIDDEKYNIFEKKFDKYNSTKLYYFTDSMSFGILGEIYFNNSFERFTMTLYEKTGPNSHGWGTDDGLMISAPATNREEALIITNELMYKYFNDKFTEFE